MRHCSASCDAVSIGPPAAREGALSLTLTAADGSASPVRGATLAFAFAFAYAVGLGVPFIVIGALLDRGAGVLAGLRRHSLRLERAGGVTLVVVGVLLVTGLRDRVLVALQPAVSGFTPVL